MVSGVAYAVDTGSAVVTGQGAQPTSGYKEGHGPGNLINKAYASDPERTIRFVRYVPPPTIGGQLDRIVSKDMAVIWCTDASGDDGVTVTLSITSQDTRIAGILLSNALPPISTDIVSAATGDIGKRNWAWLQTYGKATAYFAITGGSATAGHAFGLSTITGEIGHYTISPESTTAHPLPGALGQAGFFYDAETAGQDGCAVFLRCE